MKKIKKACCTALIVGMMLPQVVTCGAVSAASGTWKHNAKGWWYSYSDGSYAKSTWEKIGGKWYYFDSNGYMVTGWKQIGKKWYYFNTNGVMVTGWKQIGKKWYFFNTSGVMVTGWKQIGKKWYFFNTSGVMVTGWKQITKQWYYFDNNGCMANSSRVIKGKYYRFANDGKWINDENAYLLIHEKKYYFADGYGIKNLADAENGFEWDDHRYFRKVLKDGTVTTDPAYASTHSDGSKIILPPEGSGIGNIIDEKRGRVGTHVTYNDLLKIHGLVFYTQYENDTLFPQISEENENAFLYHPSPVAQSQNYVTVECDFVVGNRIVGTDFVDEDYEKVVKAWKKYGTNEKFNEEVQRAVKNGESSCARLYDWCDDENYLPFLLENGAFGDDRNRDRWEEMVQNKDQYRVVLTRCKLLGMVYSGEIKQFAEISRNSSASSWTITIYAQDSELIRILDNYKIPSDWYEDKLSN